MSARPNRFAESGFRQGFQRSNCEKIPADAPQFKIDGATRVDLPRTLPGPRPNFKVRAARLQTLCFNVSAIIRHRTVNLVVLATTADGKTCSNESRDRRFQDFFLRFNLSLPSVARIILSRIPKQKTVTSSRGIAQTGVFGRKKNQLSYHRSYRREGINSHRLEDPARPDEAG